MFRFATIVLLLIASTGPGSATGAAPSVDDLVQLLGLDMGDPKVQALVAKYDLTGASKGPSGSFSSADYSFSILYRENIIVRALFAVRWPKDSELSPYTGELPFMITADQSPQDLIRRFGKPKYDTLDKAGTGSLGFTEKRLTVSFDGGAMYEIAIDNKPFVLRRGTVKR